MYTAKVGDILRHEDGEEFQIVAFRKDGYIDAMCVKHIKNVVKKGEVYSKSTLEAWLRGWELISCKENRINALLAKIDEQEGN